MIETTAVAGASIGATAAAASRQACGFTAMTNTRASARSSGPGWRSAPDRRAASPGVGSSTMISAGARTCLASHPWTRAPPMWPAPTRSTGPIRGALGLAVGLEHAAGHGLGCGLAAGDQEVEGRVKAVGRLHRRVDDRRRLGHARALAARQGERMAEDDL